MQLNGIQGNELLEQIQGRGIGVLVSADSHNKRFADELGVSFIQNLLCQKSYRAFSNNVLAKFKANKMWQINFMLLDIYTAPYIFINPK
jgi:hypothetical protein